MIACPNCGANLKFNPKTQTMLCDFCASEFDPKLFGLDKDAEEQTIPQQEYGDGSEQEETAGEDYATDTYQVTIFTCPQCGGELLSVDENTAAAFCSFCGASTILSSRISRDRRPEYIIPFSKTKEDCKEAYLKLVRKALFLPKEYKSAEYIDGFRGIYMPYWSYDVVQEGKVRLKGERSHRSGDYIITDHYALTGEIDAAYDGLSYDAASSFSDSISEALAPFDVTKRVPFEPSYMSGYYADIADVDKKVYAEEASNFAYDRSLERIKEETAEFRKYTITEDNPKAAISSNPETRTAFSSKTMNAHSSMYPVWFLSYRNGDRVTYATVNGQTGKVAADLPVDVTKYLIGTAVLAVIIFMFLNMFLVLTPKVLLGTAVVLTVMEFIINMLQRSTIEDTVRGDNDKGLKHIINKKRLASADRKKENSDVLPNQVRVEEAEMDGLEKILLATGIIMVIVELLTLFLIQPVHDMPYYVMVMINAVIFMFNFRYTFNNYNIMATRRLPQFDRKGGDDRA
ncbi:MAG: hypothetical protein K6G27_13380 [Lachnospiraceae bacterium]|nr:hypothetical protein [Lachnospiraceae bacterium]